MEAMESDFPYARTLLIIGSERHIKKSGKTTFETRFYLSSHKPGALGPERWLDLVRGHWGGVEIRNHWRRDACMGEDRSRTRNPNILINMALIRSAVLRVLNDAHPGQSLPALREAYAANPSLALSLIKAHL
jgi:predicted transposase YbfD/YdcC